MVERSGTYCQVPQPSSDVIYKANPLSKLSLNFAIGYNLFMNNVSRQENLSMTFAADGKMKLSFCQNTEKLDSCRLLSCLTRYID